MKNLWIKKTSALLIFIILLGVDTKLRHPYFISNVTLGIYLMTILFLLSNRLVFSSIGSICIALFIRMIDYTKYTHLGEGFQITDIIFVSQADQDIFDFITSYLSWLEYLGYFICISLFLYSLLTEKQFFHLKNKGDNLILRFTMNSIGIFLIFIFYYQVSQENSRLQRYVESDLINDYSWYFPVQRRFGVFSGSIMTSRYNISKPDLLSDSELIKSKIYIAQQKVLTPHIILIFNESTFNPKMLDYKFAENLSFEIFGKGENFGLLKVNVIGGGSWTTEYEIITGINTKDFDGRSDLAFFTMAPLTKTSLYFALENEGYHSTVIYPLHKNFMNGRKGSEYIGVSDIYDIHDLGFYRTRKNKLVGDELLFNKVNDLIKDAKVPQLIFVVTISNHGPHKYDYADDIGCSKDLSQELCSNINDYLDRLTSTDIAFQKLKTSLFNTGKPTLIVSFGDHMPSFGGKISSLKLKNGDNHYTTFYSIFANFELNNIKIHPTLSTNFVSSMILDLIGRNNNEFYQANSLMRDFCDGIYDQSCKEKNPILFDSYKALEFEQIDENLRKVRN